MVSASTLTMSESPQSVDRDDRDAALREDAHLRAVLAARTHVRRVDHRLAGVAVAVWAVLAVGAVTIPTTNRFIVHGQTPLAWFAGAICALLVVTWAMSGARALAAGRSCSRWLGRWSPWWIASGLVIVAWDLVTAVLGLVGPPYVPPPGQLFTEAWTDRSLLGQSIAHSAVLLALGLLIGGILGLATGMWMGWSRNAAYWINPIVKYIGPVPTLAWIPIAFIAFPNTFWAAVFLVSLTVWFPMTVLTSAGVRSVPRTWFDVCHTLGASPQFLVFKVSLPAALPNIFTGIFMALPTAFVTLTIAETLGVNSGLGWYINWKKGWSAYPAMYAAIAIMVVLCGTLLTVELAIRNRVLAWQEDLTRW